LGGENYITVDHPVADICGACGEWPSSCAAKASRWAAKGP